MDKRWYFPSSTGASLTEVTYQELVDLRDSAALVPGSFYCITDFVTTCNSHGTDDAIVDGVDTVVTTSSAGHPFDLIVFALSSNTLSAYAQARLHAGDTYFAECNLAAWEILYDLDNDESKYLWADSNGKGVIYYLKDENGNECCYDFKNILYSRSKASNIAKSTVPADLPVYTFHWDYHGEALDLSLNSIMCFENKIDGFYEGEILLLNDNIFYYSLYESPEYSINGNVLKGNCRHNVFGYRCFCNTLGHSCANNAFGYGSRVNTFGNNCEEIIFGYNCENNIFENSISKCIFGGVFNHNLIYSDCSNIKFKAGSSTSTKYLERIQHCIFEPGVRNMVLYYTGNVGSNIIQRIRVESGIQSNSKVQIPVIGQDYPLVVKQKSDGSIYIGKDEIIINDIPIQTGDSVVIPAFVKQFSELSRDNLSSSIENLLTAELTDQMLLGVLNFTDFYLLPNFLGVRMVTAPFSTATYDIKVFLNKLTTNGFDIYISGDITLEDTIVILRIAVDTEHRVFLEMFRKQIFSE